MEADTQKYNDHIKERNENLRDGNNILKKHTRRKRMNYKTIYSLYFLNMNNVLF